jgi:hypothetical protein
LLLLVLPLHTLPSVFFLAANFLLLVLSLLLLTSSSLALFTGLLEIASRSRTSSSLARFIGLLELELEHQVLLILTSADASGARHIAPSLVLLSLVLLIAPSLFLMSLLTSAE